MTSMWQWVEDAASAVRERCGEVPEVAVVLGSGLGDFADAPTDPVVVPYGDLPHWPLSSVPGHAGELVVGKVAGKRVAVLAGRVHYYEGHSLDTVVFAARVMARIGVRHIILTNAAGGINATFSEGALMVIDDHINLLGSNPLIGPNDDGFGPRFPDMSEVYSKRLRGIADTVGKAKEIPVMHGIYAAMHGPSYETPAEVRFLRTIGADAVGMSTAPEAIAARHMGMQVLGVSCITNMAAGMRKPLNHAEVMETARRVRGSFMALLEGVIERT